eukprot:TRINITY_DN13567_c0_g1_i1.p1 TRINITY_DN13567_c0_g1~~TRINITY_DN13567_c0_g1_i1.p1  ORF type:complete len:421 (+),score=68.99 TRINITY_DN13567_c0_g1_i1:50-1264(+)
MEMKYIIAVLALCVAAHASSTSSCDWHAAEADPCNSNEAVCGGTEATFANWRFGMTAGTSSVSRPVFSSSQNVFYATSTVVFGECFFHVINFDGKLVRTLPLDGNCLDSLAMLSSVEVSIPTLGTVYIYNAASDQIVRKVPIGTQSDGARSVLTLPETQQFLVRQNTYVSAYNSSDGTLQYSVALRETISDFVVSGNQFVVVTDQSVESYTLDNGAPLFSQQVSLVQNWLSLSPSAQLVYFAYIQTSVSGAAMIVRALNLKDGSQAWDATVQHNPLVGSNYRAVSAVDSNGNIYVSTMADSRNATTITSVGPNGKIRWSHTSTDAKYWLAAYTSPVVNTAHDQLAMLFSQSSSYQLVLLRASTGAALAAPVQLPAVKYAWQLTGGPAHRSFLLSSAEAYQLISV